MGCLPYVSLMGLYSLPHIIRPRLHKLLQLLIICELKSWGSWKSKTFHWNTKSYNRGHVAAGYKKGALEASSYTQQLAVTSVEKSIFKNVSYFALIWTQMSYCIDIFYSRDYCFHSTVFQTILYVLKLFFFYQKEDINNSVQYFYLL